MSSFPVFFIKYSIYFIIFYIHVLFPPMIYYIIIFMIAKEKSLIISELKKHHWVLI